MLLSLSWEAVKSSVQRQNKHSGGQLRAELPRNKSKPRWRHWPTGIKSPESSCWAERNPQRRFSVVVTELTVPRGDWCSLLTPSRFSQPSTFHLLQAPLFQQEGRTHRPGDHQQGGNHSSLTKLRCALSEQRRQRIQHWTFTQQIHPARVRGQIPHPTPGLRGVGLHLWNGRNHIDSESFGD